MQKVEIQEEREARNASKEELMTIKAKVVGLKELIKQFMASQGGTSK